MSENPAVRQSFERAAVIDEMTARPCPLCGGPAGEPAFPFATSFNGQRFGYLRCRSCESVFVDPVPTPETFAKMYAKSAYHDSHYIECESPHYRESAALLKTLLPAGASALDYGCGLGLFLRALHDAGFAATGVEFDQDAAAAAAKASGCPAYALEEFAARSGKASVDVLHLGDVLEHLPDPAKTLDELLIYLKPGGLLFIEGPLENNASPVSWAAHSFGAMKRLFKPGFVGSAPPTHLLRVDAAQQLAFFRRHWPHSEMLHWSVYETGWPYQDGGGVKRVIAGLANMLGGRRLFGVVFGNRFRGVFRMPTTQSRS